MTKPVIVEVLSDRYASEQMADIWSARRKIILERELWVALLKAQIAAGIAAPEGAVEAYEAVIDQVDLESIAAREVKLRHDVKARIEEFNELAGYEVIHRGMTSRDLTDNVEQLQIKLSMELVRDRLVAVLMNLAKRAQEHTALAMVGRSHNTPAQATTLGKRFASAGTEVMVAFTRLEELIARYALRGVRGPMGTSQDQLELLDGDREALKVLEAAVVEHLGFSASLGSTGQVYPRSMDYEVATAVAQVAAGPSSLATTLRLMAGFDLSNEGFKEGQVGSSAMPHKMNSRTCERICGFKIITDGYVTMTAGLSGDQWQEGDVSCSVVRRVALPGIFFAIDGQLEALLTVLDEFGVYPAVIQRELDRYFPFLTTTKILAAAMKQQQGREEAYAAIQEHAKAVVLAMRESGFTENDLYQRLADDPRIDLSLFEILALIDAPLTFVGNAEQQTFDFYFGVNKILARFSDEVITYHPAPIL